MTTNHCDEENSSRTLHALHLYTRWQQNPVTSYSLAQLPLWWSHCEPGNSQVCQLTRDRSQDLSFRVNNPGDQAYWSTHAMALRRLRHNFHLTMLGHIRSACLVMLGPYLKYKITCSRISPQTLLISCLSRTLCCWPYTNLLWGLWLGLFGESYCL